MNTHFLSALSLLSLPLLLASCYGAEDPTTQYGAQTTDLKSLVYDADGIWKAVNTTDQVTLGDVVFSHQYTQSEWGDYVQGFTPSRSGDKANYPGQMYDHQYDCIAGHGSQGSASPFLTACWSTSETASTPLAERTLSITPAVAVKDALIAPVSVMINNSSYAYYAMKEGDNYARKFEEGDSFKVIAHGILPDGKETVTTFSLADGTNILDHWTQWDLTPLGEVTAIYFTMESSDSGAWGMNTPGYFCLDRFSYYLSQK